MSHDNQDDRELEREALEHEPMTQRRYDEDLGDVWLAMMAFAAIGALLVPFGLWKVCELLIALWRWTL